MGTTLVIYGGRIEGPCKAHSRTPVYSDVKGSGSKYGMYWGP